MKDDDNIASHIQTKHYKKLGPHGQALKNLEGNVWSIVHPKKRNLDKTTQSWDHNRPTTYLDKENSLYLTSAIHLFSTNYLWVFNECIMSQEQIMNAIDVMRSAGWPWGSLGFKTKGEVMASNIWKNVFPYMDSNDIPIWSTSGKIEPKEIEDINKDKIRIFQIPPIHFLYYQLKYGKLASERLKMHKWSYYGFNPYRGGFDGLARKLLTKRNKFCYDISGWDKFIPLLHLIYSIIDEPTRINFTDPKDHEMWDWVMQNTCNFILKMPNGDVVLKDFGNASGSGMTTRDNIIAHIIVMCFLLTKAYHEKMGEMPSLELLEQQIVALFGDDCVASVDDEFNYICQFDWLKTNIWHFGLELKFLEVSTTDDLSRLSFLGAHFTLKSGKYLPRYSTSRLAFSCVYGENQPRREEYAQKLFTLMVMSYATEEYQIFKDAATYYFKNEHFTTPTELALQRSFPINDDSLWSFFTGAESCGFHDLFFFHEDVTVPQAQLDGGGTNHNVCTIKMTTKMNNAQLILNKAVENKILTASGLQWLKVATNPCPDGPVTYSGMPDQITGKSVAFEITQELNLIKSSTLAPGNWSVRIGTHPFVTQYTGCHGTTRGAFSQKTIPASECEVNGVAIQQAVDGQPFVYGNVVGQYQGINLPNEYTEGSVRVCGMGLEVINTTSELYKQGLCTIATMSQPDVEPYYFVNGVEANNYASSSGFPVRGLPVNLSEMVLLDHAQWNAADGAYIPIRMKPNRTVNLPTPNQPIIYTGDDPSSTTATVLPTIQPKISFVTLAGSTTQFGIMDKNVIKCPSDSAVIMLTGLSEQTSLTVRVRYWLERFPSDAEPELLPLTKMSARYDPMALEIYSKWLSVAPVGCKFTDNPDGEWWLKTLGSLASLVGPLITMIPHPIAKGAGAMITMGGPVLTQMGTRTTPKNKSRKIKAKNSFLNEGHRGRKNNIQGPLAPTKEYAAQYERDLKRKYKAPKNKQPR